MKYLHPDYIKNLSGNAKLICEKKSTQNSSRATEIFHIKKGRVSNLIDHKGLTWVTPKGEKSAEERRMNLDRNVKEQTARWKVMDAEV